MSNYKNSKRNKRIKKVGFNLTKELEKEFSKMSLRCKFNFSYMDVNQGGAINFSDLTEEQLGELVSKIRDFSKESLQKWGTPQHGGDPAYKNYIDFPANSNFVYPSFVPDGVHWGCFRIEGDFHLAGFSIPYNIAKDFPDLDTNTFYVVFIDPEHNFWPSKKKHT